MNARNASSSRHVARREGLARSMRAQPTKSERLLWAELSGGKLGVWRRSRQCVNFQSIAIIRLSSATAACPSRFSTISHPIATRSAISVSPALPDAVKNRARRFPASEY
jgi:hypothetical protein